MYSVLVEHLTLDLRVQGSNPAPTSENHFLVGGFGKLPCNSGSGTRLLLAGEERSLDEWGKIRTFKVGPQVSPWRDRLSNAQKKSS